MGLIEFIGENWQWLSAAGTIIGGVFTGTGLTIWKTFAGVFKKLELLILDNQSCESKHAVITRCLVHLADENPDSKLGQLAKDLVTDMARIDEERKERWKLMR